jgi:carbohydrate-selective porin OprB
MSLSWLSLVARILMLGAIAGMGRLYAGDRPPAWTLHLNSTTVAQIVGGAARETGSLLITYYRAEGEWAGSRMGLKFEVEGGQATGSGLGARIGSQWNLNEVEEESPFCIAVLQAQGDAAHGRIHWQLGKISPKGSFDDNRAARSKLTKFIAEPLVRNSAVAFGGKGLGGVAKWDVSPGLQIAVCGSDANARSTEVGFSSWRGEWFRGAEVTFRPRSGAAIRLLAWGTERGGVHDGGWGLSGDWEFAEHWIGFIRAGGGSEWFAHSRQLISGGLAWTAPFGRAGDFLAIGFARGDPLHVGSRTELLGELVYRLRVNQWLEVSPDVQHVRHPANAPVSGAWVFGMRCAISLEK